MYSYSETKDPAGLQFNEVSYWYQWREREREQLKFDIFYRLRKCVNECNYCQSSDFMI